MSFETVSFCNFIMNQRLLMISLIYQQIFQ